jgi:outer membrane protein TolC
VKKSAPVATSSDPLRIASLLRPILARLVAAASAVALLAVAPRVPAAPLSLDEALALAARKNADLLSGQADVETSRAEVSTARSAVLPRLDLTAAVGRQAWGDGISSAYGLSFPQRSGSTGDDSLGLQATQTLVDLSRFGAIEQARQGARASTSAQHELALLVAFQVTQRFYELVKQERSLDVLEKTATRSAELVERADALFAAGRTPKSETYAARVNLGNDRIAVEQQRLRVTQARSSLAQALGWAEPEGLAVLAPPELEAPPAPVEEPPPLAALLASARQQRPALAAEQARIAAARAGIAVARAGDYPSLQLQGSYSRQASRLGGRDGVLGDPTRSYLATGQVVLSWNLFEGFGTRAAVDRARAGLTRAQAQAQRSDENVAGEVTGAREGVVALARQERLAADNLVLARDALRLATERFAAGLATQLEERDASLKLTQAELTLLETRIDHIVARADLARAVGGAL